MIDDNLPLTETSFFILLSLVPAPLHGYGIMKDVEEMSRGRIQLSTGTLYGALKRMLVQDWIERLEDSSPSEAGKPRKEYQLTELGRRVLSAEQKRMEALTRVASMRLQGGEA